MRVIETALDENLAPLAGYLWSQGIANRVFEERGRQVLEVEHPVHAERVRDLYAQWREGRLRLVAVPQVRPGASATPAIGWVGRVRRHPGLTIVLALAVLLFPFSAAVGDGRIGAVAALLLIADPGQVAAGAKAPVDAFGWQLWRWLTPIFLHFSVVHLAFNCVIVLELGRRVETACGSIAFLAWVALIGIASNALQWLVGGTPLFGGLSGVGYGLLGFLLVKSRRHPGDARWRLPPGLAFGLLLFLVIFTTGITEPFGLHVANAAHWAGLVTGAVLGLGRSGERDRAAG